MRLLRMGAEASIYRDDSGRYGGERVVEKRRLPKRYRHSDLDSVLAKERIKAEARLMVEARALGLSVPIIFDVDLEGKRLIMEFIAGRRAKESINARGGGKKKLCMQIGSYIGTLHANGIIHGDLTTSNMIVSGGRLYFIDFSLGGKSREIEDMGVDLHLLHEAFKSSHPENSDLYEEVLKGYEGANPQAGAVIMKMEEIEKRGRYT